MWADAKLTVCTWQQWQVQNGGHRSNNLSDSEWSVDTAEANSFEVWVLDDSIASVHGNTFSVTI